MKKEFCSKIIDNHLIIIFLITKIANFQKGIPSVNVAFSGLSTKCNFVTNIENFTLNMYSSTNSSTNQGVWEQSSGGVL